MRCFDVGHGFWVRAIVDFTRSCVSLNFSCILAVNIYMEYDRRPFRASGCYLGGI